LTSNLIGYLEISGNSSLTNLNGLSTSVSQIGNLSIYGNQNLETVNLGSVTSIVELSIINNPNLESISIQNTSTLWHLNISGNHGLENLNGFSPSITSMGSLMIRNNLNLQNID